MPCSCFWSWLQFHQCCYWDTDIHWQTHCLTTDWSLVIVFNYSLIRPNFKIFLLRKLHAKVNIFTRFRCILVFLLATQKNAPYYTVWDQKRGLIVVNNNTNYNLIISFISFHAVPRKFLFLRHEYLHMSMCWLHNTVTLHFSCCQGAIHATMSSFQIKVLE